MKIVKLFGTDTILKYGELRERAIQAGMHGLHFINALHASYEAGFTTSGEGTVILTPPQ